MKYLFKILILLFVLSTQSCGIYSFTGGSAGDAKTIQIDYFPNNAPLVEPSLSTVVKTKLEDRFLQQTNLDLVKDAGDLVFSGEITKYRISPAAATSSQIAAKNRLTIGIKVRFENKLDPDKNFDKTFSHFYDYSANDMLIGSVLEEAFDVILEKITQDIFNEALAQW